MEEKIHSKFKLQGNSFNSADELVSFSKNLSVEVFTFLTNWFNDDSFIVVNTSGSTGQPKEIQLQKEKMINSAKATGAFFNLFEGTTALLCMSVEYIAGKMMLVRALELGWEIDVVKPTSNPLENSKKQYDFCAMVPLQLSNSIAYLSNINTLIVGGGVVSSEVLKKIQFLNTSIFATYGMTETITHIAVKKLNNFSVISSTVEKSYYKTLPNIKLLADSRGCLIIDAPEICEEKIVTNDVVNIVSSTQFEWLGRFDTIINSGGIKLIPEQIEIKLSEIISERFFVAGIRDAVLGEKLILLVESEPQEKFLQRIKQLNSLSKYEFPKEIYFLQAFILTDTQKINRPRTLDLLVLN